MPGLQDAGTGSMIGTQCACEYGKRNGRSCYREAPRNNVDWERLSDKDVFRWKHKTMGTPLKTALQLLLLVTDSVLRTVLAQ